MSKKNPGILVSILVGLVLTVPLLAISFFLRSLAGLPFIPFDFFDWIARVLPGDVITFGIDMMIDTMRALNINVVDSAKTAEQVMAISMFGGMLIVAEVIFFAVLRWQRTKATLFAGLIAGVIVAGPAIAVNQIISQSSLNPILRGLYILLLFLGWGLLSGWVFNALTEKEMEEATDEEEMTVTQLDRRRFLIQAGVASAAITVVGTGTGVLLAQRRARAAEAAVMGHEENGVASNPADMLPNANDPVVPAPGTRPEYTPLKDHYKVFIRTEPTVIEGASWTLPIVGLVDRSLMLTLDDLRNNYDAMEQYVTLSCISGRIGTGLIGTTLWTGVSLQDILADAGVDPRAQYLHIQSGDGFYETVSLDLINSDPRIMLTYDWDGSPLPVDHGFPLRIYIPSRYGMKQPKWITSIEVMEDYIEGYWVERNWDEEAIMNTVSVIDTVAVDAAFNEGGDRYIPIGGMAHAGARGISRVEVRVDEGEWVEAELRAPLSETTWVIWRYDWPFEAGDHTFEVRCYETDGTPQPAEFREARPSGSTGIHSLEVEV